MYAEWPTYKKCILCVTFVLIPNLNYYMFQYGGEEFAPDSARFAAQKPGSSVYNADSYYLGN